MPGKTETPLSRRERQIMDAVYSAGEVSVSDVVEAIPDAPSYSAVRTLMGILLDKGLLKRRKDGKRHLYAPRQPRGRAAKSAARRLIDTFYQGSLERAVIGMLDASDTPLDANQRARIIGLIESAKREGR